MNIDRFIADRTPVWQRLDALLQQIESSDPTSQCCSAFDGYHSAMQTGTSSFVPYAIGCSCPGIDGPSFIAQDVQRGCRKVVGDYDFQCWNPKGVVSCQLSVISADNRQLGTGNGQV